MRYSLYYNTVSSQQVGVQMKSAAREILETIILTLIIFLLVRSVVQNFKVDGRSMEPTLESGQYLLINKAAYWRIEPDGLGRVLAVFRSQNSGSRFIFGSPQRGDVIIFKYPKDPSRDFVKRIIAVPGDFIEIKEGKVFVNDKPIVEDYVLNQPNYFVERQKVPPENYFVLGDNRKNSHDSHVWGNVPLDNIIGRAWIRYWPIDQWGIIPSGPIAAEAVR